MKTKLSTPFKRKWARALRSGRYTQNKNSDTMLDGDSYSPMGVAYRMSGVPKSRLRSRKTLIVEDIKFFPKELIDNDNLSNKIESMNRKGLSFRWLANYIDEHL